MNEHLASDVQSISPVDTQTLSAFRRKLLCWYRSNGRRFPWRNKASSKYKLVISELLLQRTRAETVARFFSAFISAYPSWQKLAKTEEVEIGDVIRPIGLWKRRAAVLKRLASVMTQKNGRFPRSRTEIESLPGVGQYIANAILLLCHGQPEPLLDSNMARVLERVFGPRKLADVRYDPYLQSLSRAIVNCSSPKEINWAILDLAATVCVPRNPRCGDCPLLSLCPYGQKRMAAMNPPKR